MATIAWFLPSEGKADTEEQIFEGIKTAIGQFKSEESRFVKKWPEEATTDEALRQLAKTMATCKEVRELNLFTNRKVYPNEIVMDRVRNDIIVGIAARAKPLIQITGTLKDNRDYSIDAKYLDNGWCLEGWIVESWETLKTTELDFGNSM